jgi:DNA repair protein RadC
MENADKIKEIKRLNNQELLSLLFSNKIRGSDLRKLTTSFATLRELLFADSERMKAIEKVDPRSIGVLKCLREIVERVACEKLAPRISIKSLGNVLDYCKIAMSTLSREQFRILFLNSANMLLFEDVEDHGCVNGIAIYVRNIAFSLCFCHFTFHENSRKLANRYGKSKVKTLYHQTSLESRSFSDYFSAQSSQ